MPRWTVTLTGTAEPDIELKVLGETVAQELLDWGADTPSVTADERARTVEIEVTVEAATQPVALVKGARVAAKALDGEPVHDVTARVAGPALR